MRRYREWVRRLGRRELALILIGAVVSAVASVAATKIVEVVP
ncbi:MAG: hypothetical protein WCD21_32905 [Streptomyces sp.]